MEEKNMFAENNAIKTGAVNGVASEHLLNSDWDDMLDTPSSDDDPSYIGNTGPAPLLSLFDNAVWSRDKQNLNQGAYSNAIVHAEMQYSPTPAQSAVEMTDEPILQPPIFISAKMAKQERVCKTLKSAIPSRRKLHEAHQKNALWWAAKQARVHGSHATADQKSVADFTSQAMAHGSPQAVAKVVQLVATVSDEAAYERLVRLVDRLVLADDDYIGTIDGLECALFQYKLYSDSGQARRSLLIYRRAMIFAQLLGLHQTRANAREDIIWWGLYQADRMTSLMLGVPYVIPDKHCNLSYCGQDLAQDTTAFGFMAKMAVISGKVVDLTHSEPAAPYSSVLEIDKELAHLHSEMVPDCWRLSQRAPNDVGRVNLWQEKAFMQMVYHQTKLLLHLPYMFKAVDNLGFEYSRNSSFQDSREILLLFHKLRAPENEFAYKCKAIDFIGFLAGTILTLGLLSHGIKSAAYDERRQREDWELVNSTMIVFERVSREAFGQVVSRCHNTLLQLINLRDTVSCDSGENASTQIKVPFFGIIKFRFRKLYQSKMAVGPADANIRQSSVSQPLDHTSWNTRLPDLPANSSFDFFIQPTTGAPSTAIEDDQLLELQSSHWLHDFGSIDPGEEWNSVGAHLPMQLGSTYFISRN
jgi:hypothetical protein